MILKKKKTFLYELREIDTVNLIVYWVPQTKTKSYPIKPLQIAKIWGQHGQNLLKFTTKNDRDLK